MKKMFLLYMLAALLSGFSAKAQNEYDNSVIDYVDLDRYLGSWYEIARFDHSFERGMYATKANYSLNEDGSIEVVNSGYKNGKFKMSVGKAKLTETPALLRVSFFGPFYSDYRILMLDPDYQFALIGSKSKNYLWILSRTPMMRVEDLDLILNEAESRGYEVTNLIWVDQ